MKHARVLLVVTLPVVLSGCILLAAAAVGGTGVLYVKGAAQKSYSHTVQRTFDAVLKALGDADVIITSQDYGADVGKVTGTASDGKKVIVDLKATGEKVTQVKVRVGTLGNRERSEYIISRIDARI